MRYNWQQKDWPDFRYETDGLGAMLLSFAEEMGRTAGMLGAMPDAGEIEATLDMMVAEAMKTSEIEGEYLSRRDVVSSIRNKLGLNKTPEKIKDKKAQGAGMLMVAVRRTFADALTAEVLYAWHKMLMGAGTGIDAGVWRKHKEPMQVISGAIGREKVHFEAPPSARVPEEMKKFLKWFNDTAPGGKKEIKSGPIRSAIAHLYFESIHPFEDGNGRIGRAIAAKALSQTTGHPLLLSLSQTIEADKKSYYSALQNAQGGNEVTSWLKYFVKVILDAQIQAKNMIDFTVRKAKFFDRFKEGLNDRQQKVIKKMLDKGPEGFEGGMTANKYTSMTRASKATATRDLQELVEMKALIVEGGGRSTRYLLEI